MVWLAQQNPANPCAEDRFHIVVVSLWHSRVPGKRRIAIATREIDFAKGKSGFRPLGFEACGLPQFAQPSIIFIRQKPANVMFKSIEAQRTLALRELRKTLGVLVVVAGEHPPKTTKSASRSSPMCSMVARLTFDERSRPFRSSSASRPACEYTCSPAEESRWMVSSSRPSLSQSNFGDAPTFSKGKTK